MSGHSKWATTKHKKAAIDAKRGKIFSKHAKLIALAAKMGGGDPATNASLAMAIERAKSENMPNSNIERAVKSGTGELKDGAEISEVMYEGYGPGGIAVYIRVITDNKNRAVSDIRHLLTNSGGSMGTSGSVSWMFKRKGTLDVAVNGKDKDELMLQLIDLGAEDVKDMGDTLLAVADPVEFMGLKKKIEEAHIPFENAHITYLPDTTVKIEEEDVARKVINMMDKLDDNDDVDEVYSNFDISDALLEKVMS
jgi:YebC/PmpR family DNA-binding regulatory protein